MSGLTQSTPLCITSLTFIVDLREFGCLVEASLRNLLLLPRISLRASMILDFSHLAKLELDRRWSPKNRDGNLQL